MKRSEKLINTVMKYGHGITCGLLLTILIIVMSFTCYGASIHGDEYFSMSFANNTEDFLFLSPGNVEKYSTNNWMNGEFLHDYLSVQEDGKFAIMTIHRNVRKDVHPPLYFMLLNCISSFFVDEVTLFPGYLINVLSGTMICIMMYLIMRKIFKDKWLALIPPLFWVLSQAGSITMTYIRMYAPLCALTLICLYLHMLYAQQKKPKWWLYLLLLGCTTVGTLTHYYYYVMQFVLFIVMIVVLLRHKRIKKLFGYGMSLLGGEIISVAAYPYVFKHLLFSDRGVQVQENLASSDLNHYIEHFKAFMNTINHYVYSNRFQKYLAALLICAIVVGIVKIIGKRYKSEEVREQVSSIWIDGVGKYNFILMIIAATGYFLILFKISYSTRWLYISPIFAMLSMITVGGFVLIVGRMPIRNYGLWLFGVAVIFMGSGITGRIEHGITQHEKIRMQHEQITEYSDTCDVLFFYDDWDNLYDSQMLDVLEFDQIRGIAIEDMESTDYQEVLSSRLDSDDLVFYIPIATENYQEKVKNVAEVIDAEEPVLISKDDHAVYLVRLK